jgi:serine protease inhibitor
MIKNQYRLFSQKTFTDAAKKGEAVDVFPHVCRASLDTMLRCSLSYKEDPKSTTYVVYPRNNFKKYQSNMYIMPNYTKIILSLISQSF